MRRLSLVLLVVCASFAGCYPAPYPVYPAPVTTPASFDKSWSAAQNAAHDVGVIVTEANRSTGRITGIKDGAGVTITLEQLPDGTLKVTFTAPDAKEQNPTLQDRWVTAYNRWMGR